MDTNVGMDMDNFTKTLVIKTGADEVYDGLTRSIRDWWSEMFEGDRSIEENVFFSINHFKKTLRIRLRLEEIRTTTNLLYQIIQ